MNCKTCQKYFDAYRDKKLPATIQELFEKHLESCYKCKEVFELETFAFKIINEEMQLQPNPFLATKIMASVENKTIRQKNSLYSTILKPALVASSMAAAIIAGVLIGNLYKPVSYNKTIPIELSYFNDSSIESVEILSDL